MKIIGITGTSGSGKTTICNILNTNYKAFVIDCDKLTRQMLTKENKYFKAIVKTFGEEILLNGQINRAKLANIIYSNKEEREKLNAITSKYIFPEVMEIIKEKENKNNILVIDAPLLIESKLSDLCDTVISVLANKEIKLERILKRDKIEKDIANARLNMQKNDEFYIQKSYYVITNNDKNIKELEKEVKNILDNVLYK